MSRRATALSWARVTGLVAVAALPSFFVARLVLPKHASTPAVAVAQPTTSVAAAPAPSSRAQPTPPTRPAPTPALEDVELPPGFSLANDKGLLEVVTPARESIYVEDAFMGRGPVRRIPLAAGAHRVQIRGEGEPLSIDLTVRPGRRVRVTIPAS